MKELIQIKVTPELKKGLKTLAKKQGLTLNAFMCVIINEHLHKLKNEQARDS